MSILRKIKHRVDKAIHQVGLSRKASKVARQLITGDVPGLLRSVQRSHKLGKLGHTAAPSMSSSNLITHAYNRAMASLSRSAMRAATKSDVVNNASSYGRTVDPSEIVSRQLDYRYHRFRGK